MPQPKHLTPLGHRIDFEALITVDSANPNGDPMKKGLPRTDSSGRGVISAVCIRRKLRNALAELGQPILISPPERPGDDLARRLSALPGNCDIPAEACRRWFDVRAFGQVFSSRGMHAPGVKGAVSIQPAVSVCPPAIVFSSVIAEPLRSRPVSFADYEITNAEIPGVKLSIFENDTLTAVGNSRRG